MECDHRDCKNEAMWEVTPRDDQGHLAPEKKKHFCSFCIMRVINRYGYRTAVIERLEEEKTNGDSSENA